MVLEGCPGRGGILGVGSREKSKDKEGKEGDG
jgi:hypothetical protein